MSIRDNSGCCRSVNRNRRRGAHMWVSRRADYATRAVLVLAIADGGPMKLEELARRTAVPQSVLEQVMPVMRTAGIVRSERGPYGGLRPQKPPGGSTPPPTRLPLPTPP